MNAESINPAIKLRRVVVDIQVTGTDADADAVRDAIGMALTEDLLMPITVEVMEPRGIEDVKWQVRGERWIDSTPNAQTEL